MSQNVKKLGQCLPEDEKERLPRHFGPALKNGPFDLEYFRRYAMPDPHRARDAKQSGDDIAKTDEPAV